MIFDKLFTFGVIFECLFTVAFSATLFLPCSVLCVSYPVLCLSTFVLEIKFVSGFCLTIFFFLL